MKAHPERLKVARICLENGLAIRADGIYLNQTEIPTARVARAAGVDRRTVSETLVDDPELVPEPKLTLIAGRSVPGDLIPKMLKITGVSKVSIL